MKILLAIITCSKREYELRRKAQEETWAPATRALGYDVQFFDGPPDDYYALPQKVKAACRYAVEHDYDYLMKLDDDTFINFKVFQSPTADYAGILQKANDYGTQYPPPGAPSKPTGTYPFSYASGGAYWLSRKAFTIIANAEPDDWAEDRWVGQTLGKHGIFVQPQSDFCIGICSTAAVCTQVGERGLRQLAELSRHLTV